MILDDEEAVRESLSEFFEDRDWKVISAETSGEALSILSSGNLEGAVVDIRLPDFDGNEFIRRAVQKNYQLAFVICTGSPEYRFPYDIAEMSQVHDEVFTKPVSDLSKLEEALLQQIKICTEEGSNSE